MPLMTKNQAVVITKAIENFILAIQMWRDITEPRDELIASLVTGDDTTELEDEIPVLDEAEALNIVLDLAKLQLMNNDILGSNPRLKEACNVIEDMIVNQYQEEG